MVTDFLTNDWHMSGDLNWKAKATPARRAVGPRATESLFRVYLQMVEDTGRKLEDIDVDGDLEAEAAARWFVSHYTGQSTFIRDLASKAKKYGLSTGQTRAALNAAWEDMDRERTAHDRQVLAAAAPAPVQEEPSQDLWSAIPDGTYTVVLEDGSHVTIRLSVPGPRSTMTVAPGTQIASYLAGPDNELDFVGFAFVAQGQAKIWGRFRTGYTRQAHALNVLLAHNPDSAAALGEAYAMMAGRCCRCGRQLTVPASLHRGMGPECAAK